MLRQRKQLTNRSKKLRLTPRKLLRKLLSLLLNLRPRKRRRLPLRNPRSHLTRRPRRLLLNLRSTPRFMPKKPWLPKRKMPRKPTLRLKLLKPMPRLTRRRRLVSKKLLTRLKRLSLT